MRVCVCALAHLSVHLSNWPPTPPSLIYTQQHHSTPRWCKVAFEMSLLVGAVTEFLNLLPPTSAVHSSNHIISLLKTLSKGRGSPEYGIMNTFIRLYNCFINKNNLLL